MKLYSVVFVYIFWWNGIIFPRLRELILVWGRSILTKIICIMIRGSNLESSSNIFQDHINLSLNDFKVEKSLKGSLDSIPSPSPSVKIQIMGGKVCFRCKNIIKKLLKTKSLLTSPTNDLNFQSRWGWWDWIQTIFLNIFYFNY